MSKKEEVNVKPIKVEEIMQEIRIKISEKKASGLYPDPSESPFAESNKIDNHMINHAAESINSLEHYSFINHNALTPSARPIIGPLITFYKRLARKSLSWYFKNQADQINAFNNQVITTLKFINQELNDIINQDTSPLWEKSYIKFEERFRGSESLISKRQHSILQFFEDSQDVLDIGCGRGEFLKLLTENNIRAHGIDANITMVERCLEKGLSVVYADAILYLKKVPENTYGGIFLGQIVEHMHFKYLSDLLQDCFKKLKSGSSIVIETPNPQSMTVSAINFCRDITHLKIIHPETLAFILESIGFCDLQIKLTTPYPSSQKLSKIPIPKNSDDQDIENTKIINKNIERLNSIIFGHQDYLLAARKP